MPTIIDEEFGIISLRRNAKASHVRIRVAPNGTLRASLPMYAPLFLVKRLIKNSRQQLRDMLRESQSTAEYSDGMQIGKSHTLVVRHVSGATQVKRHGTQIIVSLSPSDTLADDKVISLIRSVVIEALRIEAKSYLPRRLKILAQKHNYSYTKVRFSHASGRWGSCSAEATISLNIALMKLPFELIDYVLIHELVHTVHMNHAKEFWQEVEVADPSYRKHRQQLKLEAPSI